MKSTDWLQLILFVAALTALTKPLGLYLGRVLDPHRRTPFDPVLKPAERLVYRLLGLKPDDEQDWQGYTISVLLFSLVSGALTYAILRLQHLLPLNPQGLGPVPPDLAFNTAVSFVTNTNWQSYAGESTLSYFSQMVGLTLHNFTSAAAGIGLAAALVRGLARSSAKTLGHFWIDLIRITCYLLLPASFALALVLVSQGMIQNFAPATQARLVEPFAVVTEKTNAPGATTAGLDSSTGTEPRMEQTQTIAQGPMASQVAIKMLGTNGGGFANANAAHPFENPTPLANFLQMLVIFSIGAGLTHWLGQMTRSPAHGWSVWGAMLTLFLAGVLICAWAESAGNPIHHQLGVAADDGNLEGKETRFGVFNSALFATITTDASCGAVNAMHDSFTPLGGLVPLFNIQLGEIIFGGVGAGLYGMLMFVILAVFIAGLMVGRTPEYLGKKIGGFEVKMAMLSLIVLCVATLGFAAWAVVTGPGLAGLNNAGPHGLTEILYAFSSATGNNGSAFAGLSTNTPWYNLTLSAAMLIGRFGMIVPVMALAGAMARKPTAPVSSGTFPAQGGTFVLLLLAVIVLVGALNFLPALALGPIVEHFLMVNGQLF